MSFEQESGIAKMISNKPNVALDGQWVALTFNAEMFKTITLLQLPHNSKICSSEIWQSMPRCGAAPEAASLAWLCICGTMSCHRIG